MKFYTKTLAIALFACSLMAQVTFNGIPDNARRPFAPTEEFLKNEVKQTQDALSVRLISENDYDMIVLANGYQYERVFNYGPAVPFSSDGRVKTWWNGGQAFEGVFVARNPDGSWACELNQETIPGMQWATRELYDFYRLRNRDFPCVPKLVTRIIDANEAGRAQFGNGPAADFPLAKILRNDPTANFRSTFPRNVGLRINALGGLDWFRLDAYDRAYPVTTTTTIGSPSERSPGVIMATLGMLFNNPNLSAAEKFAQIKALFVP